jgi:uncharacterized cupredoxin-like copper-binding protein
MSITPVPARASTSDRRSARRVLAVPLALAGLAGAIFLSSCSSTQATGTTAPTGSATTGTGPGSRTAPVASPAALRDGVPVLTVKVSEEGQLLFVAPDSVPAGWVEVELVNNGKLAHQASLGKVREGAALDVAEQTMATDPITGIGALQEVGGANSVVGGGTSRVVIRLDPGTYYFYCMVPGEQDQKPHAEHGMVRKLVVTPPAGGSAGTVAAAEPPVRDVAGTIAMKDYGFLLPEPFTGRGWYAVTNDGPQAHELTLIGLPPGSDAKKVKQHFVDVAGGPLSTPTVSTPPPGPKPYVDAGGLSAIGTSTVSYVWLDLAKGDYVAMCYVPDVPAPGRTGTPDLKAHFVHDMWQPFTIE